MSRPDDEYRPRPVDTRGVDIPGYLSELSAALAVNAHEVWAEQRLRDGWHHGRVRDDARKLHPCLVPYDQLPDDEKIYDQNMVNETIRLILASGYRIVPAGPGNGGPPTPRG